MRNRTNRRINSRIRRRVRGGFSLIELLLVLVILAVLAAVVVPKFTGRSEDARKTAAKTDISQIETAMDTFEIENGRFPTNEEGLNALLVAPPNMPNWKKPYVKSDLKDPWGNPYVYRYPGLNNVHGFDLSSLGPDGQPSADDITNWTTKQ